MQIGIVGMGRMGRALADLAPERGFEIVARIGRGDAVTRDSLRGAAVAIEFTTPDAAVDNVLGEEAAL